MVHERAGRDIDPAAHVFAIMKTPFQQGLALVLDFQVLGSNLGLLRRDSGVQPFPFPRNQPLTKAMNYGDGCHLVGVGDGGGERGKTHPWQIGVGRGASGSSATSSHSLTDGAMPSGSFHSRIGNFPLPSAV